MVNDASIKKTMITINSIYGEIFTIGTPISSIMVDRGLAGFDVFFIFTNAENNICYITYGFAPNNDFSKFEVITGVDCIVYYIPN